MHGFSQVPCPKCSTVTWVSQQTSVGVCPSCHQQVSAPAGAPAPPTVPSAGGYVPSAVAFGRSSGGFGLRAAMVIGAVVVVGGGSVAFAMLKGKYFGSGKPNTASYVSLGLNPDHPDGDKMIDSVATHATKWKKDAHFWSVNFQAVHADGSVDVSKGAEVQYISPSRVTKSRKKDREDSIRKFSFGPQGADYSKQWDAINEWKNVEKPKNPKCAIKDLTTALGKEGLKGDKTVRISFDPQFDWKNEQLWHVIGEDPKIDAHYSMETCEKVPE